MPAPPTAPAAHAAPTAPPLAQAIVAEAIERIEQSGPLDDADALAAAYARQPTRSAQVLERAWLLGQRLGLTDMLARAGGALRAGMALLAVVVALGALGLARAVLADDRSINAIAAWASLLGLHALTLVLWLLGLVWAYSSGAPAGGLSLGRAALWLAARWPGVRTPHTATVLDAASAVLQRQRLAPWLLGAISHATWALAFVLVLGVLGFGFAFHAYRLAWETTILSSDFFVRFVQATGWLPAQLGFAVPDASAVQQAALGLPAAAAHHSAWAWWLLGSVFTYGLLPRVLLAAFSLWRWRAGVARLPARVDTASPYVRRLLARLDALAPATVVDAEQPAPSAPALPHAPPGTPGTLAVLGFELPPEWPWPPSALPGALAARAAPLAAIAGASHERAQALAQLAAARPWRLLIACHASASPDRGTARFLREAARHATHTGLWLIDDADAAVLDSAHPVGAVSAESVDGAVAPDAPPTTHRSHARWHDWLRAEALHGAITALDSPAKAIAWAEETDA